MVTFFSFVILLIGIVIITCIDSIVYGTTFLKAFMNITEINMHTGRQIVFVTLGLSFIYAIIVDYRLKGK
ncbi:hypothetical protein [Paenibacillus sp. FSL H8-0034]|uniref:hypothetical protein n=1 Tax=Paenibacillus sp. FSL H8-0034 TaxID=2954671 RepID=UPI0030FCF77D